MIDKKNLPRHIAIIMDGNGRWAKKRHLPVIFGHRQGAKTVDRITEASARLGVKELTLYSFSTENWNRSDEEVNGLMDLLYDYLSKKLKKLQKNNIRLNAVGRLDELPDKVRGRLTQAIDKTSKNDRMVLTLALNYGSRQEITDAVVRIAGKVKSADIDIDDITPDVVSEHLYTKGLGDVDLLIRTSGEMRVSNFLLWQISYAEIVITKALWPAFKPRDLEKAIEEYQARDRRFGGR
jgi:undecaprenyl diphosphate synthase